MTIINKDGTSHEVPSYIDDGEFRIKKTEASLPKSNDLKLKKPYIIDYHTKNLSFLQASMDLAKLGIEHNNFFLALFDEELRGVDPFSPFLTEDQIFRILKECEINPWYFLRECVRVCAR